MVNTSYWTYAELDFGVRIDTIQNTLRGQIPDDWEFVSTPRLSILPWFSIPDGYDKSHVTSSLIQDAKPLIGNSVAITGITGLPTDAPTSLALTCDVIGIGQVRNRQSTTVRDGFNGVVFRNQQSDLSIPLCRSTELSDNAGIADEVEQTLTQEVTTHHDLSYKGHITATTIKRMGASFETARQSTARLREHSHRNPQ